MSISERRNFTYYPALDGLRGVAVIAVVLFHSLVPGFKGGFVGVDVFFVLSGFLITTILLSDIDRNGRIDFASFYRHRVFRILPPLVAALLGFLAFSFWRGLDWVTILKEIGPPILFLTNWVRVEGYQFPIYLGHTWSLSIEEQFYLFWPVLVITLARVQHRWWSIAAILTMVIVVYTYRIYLSSISYDINVIYRTDLRSDGLLIGSTLAFAWSLARTSFTHSLIKVIGYAWPIALFALSYICIAQTATSPEMLRFGYTAASIASGVLISAVLTGKSRVLNGVLQWWPLRATGAISYGLYVYHWVLFTGFYYSGVSEWRIYIGIPLSFMLATASFLILERPMLQLRRRLDRQETPLRQVDDYAKPVSS